VAERHDVVDFKLMNGIGHRRKLPAVLLPSLLWLLSRSAGNTRSAHHVDDAGGKAEQEKHDHPPRRDSEPLVERPADERADQDTGDQFGGETETAGQRRRIALRTGPRFDLWARSLLVGEPFAETLKPRGESGLFGRPAAV